MTKTVLTESKSAASANPRAPLTPAEALKTVINLANMIAGNRATADARRRELIDALGTDDITAVLSKEPERAGEVSEHVLMLEMQLRLSETAANAASGRIRELGQIATQELLRMKEELAALHEETSALVMANVRQRISAIDSDLFTPTQLQQLAGTTGPVREQRNFEMNHPGVSIPEVIGYVDGVCTSVPADEVFAAPHHFSQCHESLTRSTEAARARLSMIKRLDARKK